MFHFYSIVGIKINLFVTVMYTLYLAVSRSLPTTAYMKVIDYWLLFHLVVPFLIFLLLFLVEHSVDDSKDVVARSATYVHSETSNQEMDPKFKKWSEKKKLNKKAIFIFLGRIIMPLIVIVFVITYWIIVLCYYYS